MVEGNSFCGQQSKWPVKPKKKEPANTYKIYVFINFFKSNLSPIIIQSKPIKLKNFRLSKLIFKQNSKHK